MIVWKTNEMNYATVDLDGRLYDVHFRYYGNASYMLEHVYELAVVDLLFDLLPELDTITCLRFEFALMDMTNAETA